MTDAQIKQSKDFEDYVDLLVESVKAFKQAKADGVLNFSDIAFLIPVFMKVGGAIEGSSNITIDSLSSAQLKADALKILAAFDNQDAKLAIYIDEVLNIVSDATKIWHAVARIKAA